MIGAIVVEKVQAGVIISSLGFKSNAFKPNNIAEEPLFTKRPYFFPNFSGIIAIESTKELYKAVPSASYSKRFKLNLATTYAGKQTASSSTPEKR